MVHLSLLFKLGNSVDGLYLTANGCELSLVKHESNHICSKTFIKRNDGDGRSQTGKVSNGPLLSIFGDDTQKPVINSIDILNGA